MHAQVLTNDQLEQHIYQLNNALRYTESQKILLPLVNDKSIPDSNRYKAAILLSYTYKRVYDYQAALNLLDLAYRLIKHTPKSEENIAFIQSEQAFIHFDERNYSKANSIMEKLNRSGFKYISLENKAKLLMQQGYLLYLKKEYSAAELMYDKAIQWMTASTPCHLPMIFVKKMQLYNAIHRDDLLDKTIQLSVRSADSCHIIKYHLYANEELLGIYLSRNDVAHAKATKEKLDSLNTIYKREEKIASLHAQKETILLTTKENEIRLEKFYSKHLTIILIGCLLLIILLAGCLFMYNKYKQRAEDNYEKAKIELATFVSKRSKIDSLRQTERPEVLSQRQYNVLECMMAGMSNKQIADKLFISENTVKYHVKNIYQLLDIKDRKELLVSINKLTKLETTAD
jgi:DNA-binding CsgD family transcriptional regulator